MKSLTHLMPRLGMGGAVPVLPPLYLSDVYRGSVTFTVKFTAISPFYAVNITAPLPSIRPVQSSD